jgi:hypothetical protein
VTNENLVAFDVDVSVVVERDKFATDHLIELFAWINSKYFLQTRDEVLPGLDLSVVTVDCDGHQMVTMMGVVVVRAFHRRAMGWVMILHLLIHLLNGDRRRGIRLHERFCTALASAYIAIGNPTFFRHRKEFSLPGKIAHLQSLIKVRETDGRNFVS